MPDNTIASYKALIEAQKQALKAVEASQTRIEATLALIQADVAVILAHLLQHEDKPTFADLVRAGKEDVGTLARYIAEFQESDAEGPLHDYLGLTKTELLKLLNDPKDYHWILGDVTDTPEEE